MASVLLHKYRQVMQRRGRDAVPLRTERHRRWHQQRDFVHVDDCVAVMLWLLDNPAVSGMFNVGSGRARSFLDLVRAMFAAMGREPDIRFVDMPADLLGKVPVFHRGAAGPAARRGLQRPDDAAGRRGAPHRAGLPGDRGSLPLMLFAIPFPVIDPVLVQIGPFAIRWYALAYIAGIVLGWRLARRLVRAPPAGRHAEAGR